jgi:TPP-dependent pyruvate/acetoin dehydrogenase alpha subunit
MATILIDPSGDQPVSPGQQPFAGIAAGPEVAASPSDPNMLRRLYAAMLRCCVVEEHAERLAQSRKLKSLASPGRGLEATAIGSLIELRAGDAISSELGFAAHMFSGRPLGLYFAGIYGLSYEYLAFAPQAANSAIHVLPAAQTVAAQLNIAAGFALALKQAQCSNVVLVHLPDGTNALGYWHDAAILAAAERLPVIFVSISEPAGRFGNSDLRQRASAYGIPGITVDGGDLVAMWRVAQESIHRARSGAGPTLIDSQIPAAQSNASSTTGTPLARMQHYLEKRKLWDESWKDGLVQKLAAEIAEAQAFFLQTNETQ